MSKPIAGQTLLAVVFIFALCLACSGAPIYDPQPTLLPKPATTWIASPNYGLRNNNAQIDSIVLHTTEVPLDETFDIFLDPARQVSAHFVIASSGDIYQMVETRNRAWHATYYNHRSIGIEMVGYAGQSSTWNPNNLGSLTKLIAWLIQAYPQIPLTHPSGNAYDYPGDAYNAAGLVAHGQVQPWNRSDPGRFFPWNQVLTDVAARIASSVPEPSSVFLLAFGTSLGLCRWRKR